MKNLFIYLIFTCLTISLQAQPGRRDIRQGNRYFKSEKFDNAELAYRRAAEEKKVNKIAEFNLGDALYRQKKYEEAGRQFEAAASSDAVKTNTAKAYHNLGNSLLQAGKIDESINAYKDALRKNPVDLDTKYNLSYAQMMKKKQEQQKDKNDKSDKNDKNDNNDKSDKKDNNEKDEKKDQDQQKQEQQQAKQQNVKISKEDAKRLLEALATDEKKVQEKVKKDKANASKVRTLKDW